MVFRKIHKPAKRFSAIVVSGLNIERRDYAIGEDLECALQYSFKNLTTHCDHRKRIMAREFCLIVLHYSTLRRKMIKIADHGSNQERSVSYLILRGKSRFNLHNGVYDEGMASGIQETIPQTFLIGLLHNSASNSQMGEVE